MLSERRKTEVPLPLCYQRMVVNWSVGSMWEIRKSIVGLMLLCMGLVPLQGQDITSESEDQDTSKGSLIIIDYADTTKSFLNELGEEVLILTGNVQLHQDSLFMQCDSTRKESNNLYAVGNVILQQWDSLNVFADTLTYLGDEEKADLKGEVYLQNQGQVLYTQALEYDVGEKVARYHNRAWISDDTTTITSIKGTYYVDNDVIYFRDSVYVESNDFRLFADTLQYQSENKIVTFLGPTVITMEDSAQIYCEGGYYNLQTEEGVFTDNPQYVKDDRQATGDTIFYAAEQELVTISGSSEIKEEDRFVSGDLIVYDLKNEIVNISGNGLVIDSSRVIESDRIRYDVATDQFVSEARTNINDGPQTIEADSIDFNNQSGLAQVRGNIIWQDTSSDYTIFTERADYRDSLGYLKAFHGRPVLLSVVDGDSLFLSSDTLISYEQTTLEDTFRIFLAFHNVKIYKSDLQATCDSLAYSARDSVFHLYDEPILWSDTSQFTADSMKIYMAQSQIDYILLDQNAFIVNSSDLILFNQMKGKNIRADFADGELDRMHINGNAESVYYALDDSGAYIGVNKTLCSTMLLRMGNNQVSDIVFYSSPKATFHPIQDANHEELKLEGFIWQFEQRPKSQEDARQVVVQ